MFPGAALSLALALCSIAQRQEGGGGAGVVGIPASLGAHPGSRGDVRDHVFACRSQNGPPRVSPGLAFIYFVCST